MTGNLPRSHVLLSLACFVFLLVSSSYRNTAAQGSEEERKEVFQRAENHFNKGEYSQAYFYYNRLLERFPRDHNYHYAAGMCLAEQEKDLSKAIELLTFASTGDIPYKVHYYLGKAYFLNGQYTEAKAGFERFSSLARGQEVKDLRVEEYLQMCSHRLGGETKPVPDRSLDRKDIAVIDQPVKKESPETAFPADDQTGKAFDRAIDEALRLQARADSFAALAGGGREKYAAATQTETKRRILAQVNYWEEQAEVYQQRANIAFAEAGRPDKHQVPAVKVPVAASFQEAETGKQTGPVVTDIPEQTADMFYTSEPYRKLFRRTDLDKLEALNNLEREGNMQMKRAREAEFRAEETRLKADGAKNANQQKKHLAKMKKFQDDALDKKLRAVVFYHAANEDRYLLFQDAIRKSAASVTGPGAESKTDIYAERARNHYEQVVSLRQKAEKERDPGKRYQGLVEAHSHQLLTLENQKRAMGTMLGVAGTDEEMVAVSTPVSDKLPAEKISVPESSPARSIPESPPITIEEKPPVQQAERLAAPMTAGDRDPGAGQAALAAEKPAERTVPPETARVAEPVTNTSMNVDLLYKVQVGVYSHPMGDEFFRGLGPVSHEPIPDKGLIRYYLGSYRKFVDAESALQDIRKAGFADAFIVSSLNGARIALPKARSIEQEQGMTKKKTQELTQEKIDWQVTEGSKPVYKVQIGAFRGTPSAAVEQAYQKTAPGERIEKIFLEEGITIFTIGNFHTFEDAVNYRNRLTTGGMKDSFVIAILEGKRISIGEARKMGGK